MYCIRKDKYLVKVTKKINYLGMSTLKASRASSLHIQRFYKSSGA